MIRGPGGEKAYVYWDDLKEVLNSSGYEWRTNAGKEISIFLPSGTIELEIIG